MQSISKNKIYSEIRSYAGVTFGLFLYVVAWVAFLIPNGIVGGGATGFATVVYYVSGQAIPVSHCFFILNAVLLVAGFGILGNSFGIKTIYGIAFTFIMLAVLPEPRFITESFRESDKLICAIIGGIISGFGIAITFKNGGSAGGTDIVAMIVSKYRNMSPGKVFLYADLIIIGSSFFISWDFRTVVYGYVTMAVFSYSVDLLLSGSKQSVQLIIISSRCREIAGKINSDSCRVTPLSTDGWDDAEAETGSKALFVIVRKRDMKQVYQIINSIDKDAFISESNVTGVYGRGFDAIKIK